jgi:hypothetical protein
MAWHGMWHAWKRREMHPKFWWENLKERDHLEDVDTDGRIIIKVISKKLNGCELDSSGEVHPATGSCEHGINLLAQ